VHGSVQRVAIDKHLSFFVERFVDVDGNDCDDERRGKLMRVAQRTIRAFFRTCGRDLAQRYAKPETLKRSAAAIKKEDADGARQVSTTTMVSSRELSAKRRKTTVAATKEEEEDDNEEQ
jgi:hypothetical protein